VYDRRPAAWVQLNTHVFEARYVGGDAIDVLVNPEYGAGEAAMVAQYYAHIIGQLPRRLRRDIDALWIHRGSELFGGGNRSILIHTGSIATDAIAAGFIEEMLLHEAVHTSLDAEHASAPGWLAAQSADGAAISSYAAAHPAREDLAETFGPWFALRHRAGRIGEEMASTIAATIPHRLAYLDSLDIDLAPTAEIAQPNDQAWITGLGRFDGERLLIEQAQLTRGGVFGAAFDADAVERRLWGQLSIMFDGCEQAELEYSSALPGIGDGRFALARVARSTALDACGPADSGDHAGKAGAWIGVGRDGEGLLIDVLADGRAFVAWFTYGPSRRP
jgi:hypothetical protein